MRVCSEAGGCTKHRPLLNTLAVPSVSPTDRRELDLVVSRLAILESRTVIGDVTLRSPMSMESLPKNHAKSEKGSTFHDARLTKRTTYPELIGEHPHFEFLVLACEVGGHLSVECHQLLKQLVKCRASVHPPHLRPFFKNMYKRRWYGIISCAIQRAVAWNIAGSGEVQFTPLRNMCGVARYQSHAWLSQ